MIERGTDRALVTDFGIAVRGRAGEGGAGEVVGHGAVHEPRAGARRDRGRAQRPLLARGDDVLRPHGPAAVRGIQPAGHHHEAGLDPGAAPPDRPARSAGPARRAGGQVPAEGPGGAGPDRRRGRAHRGGGAGPRPPGAAAGALVPEERADLHDGASWPGTFGGSTVGRGGASVSFGGLIGTVLIVQLVIVARRLLREGYTFADIRTALLAEAQVQTEEADEMRSGKWIRRLNNLWHRLWAGRFGRWFFRVAGAGIKPPRAARDRLGGRDGAGARPLGAGGVQRAARPPSGSR